MHGSTKDQLMAVAFQYYLGLLILGAHFVVDGMRKGWTSVTLAVVETIGIALLVVYVIRQRSGKSRTGAGRLLRLEEKVRGGLDGEAQNALRKFSEIGDDFVASFTLHELVKDQDLSWSRRAMVATIIGQAPDPSGIRALQEVFSANAIGFVSSVDDYSRGPYLRKHHDPAIQDERLVLAEGREGSSDTGQKPER
jgi:hypothetical protein